LIAASGWSRVVGFGDDQFLAAPLAEGDAGLIYQFGNGVGLFQPNGQQACSGGGVTLSLGMALVQRMAISHPG
jgi:hypothetical protein